MAAYVYYSDNAAFVAVLQRLQASRFSQPLHIEAGEMGLRWSTGRTIDGLLLQGNADVTLTPSGQEITVGVGHHVPLSDNITMEVRAGLTLHSRP
ncbi:MAG: hypothetical protein V6Z81_07100 [Parvularculales bacterium]